MYSRLFKQMLAAGLLTSAVGAIASPISVPAGPLFIQYTNDEQFSISNSITDSGGLGLWHEGNWGVIQISSINLGTAQSPLGSDIQGGGANVFSDGGIGGHQITGIFYGAQLIPGTQLDAYGGVVDLYWQEVGTANTGASLTAYNPAFRTAQNAYTGYAEPGNPNFTFLAELNYVRGCDSANAYTICAGVIPTPTANGDAASYQSVNTSMPGLWTTALDTNFFTLDANNNTMSSPADIRTDSIFRGNGASGWDGPVGTDIIGLRSNDPIRAYGAPEPGSLALVGLGLLGFAFSGRRSRKQA